MTQIPTLKDPQLWRHQALLNGQWIDANQQATFSVHNPATRAELACVPNLGVNETQRALDAANAAWPAWRHHTGKERSQILRRWFDLITQHQDDLAAIMTAEQGKPLADALGEIRYGAAFVEWFAEEAKRVYGDVLTTTANDRRMLVLKQPIGVCAAITPWNFPMAMITRHAAPALAAGCTVVIKPAEQTPLSALALAELAQRAGFPSGVINVLTADSSHSIAIGRLICASPIVRKLSFTGSTAVGRILMQQSAPTIKKLSLELGGHAPFIVFEDADIDAAVEGAMQSKYRNSGQACTCTNRFYVHEKIYDGFVEKFAAHAAQLKVGNGFDAGVQQGPLIDAAALAKVEAHVANAVASGATLVTGGQRHALGGTFYQPTVLATVNTSMLIAHEETFGPIAPFFKFSNDDEVITQANNTEYGLAAYFYSRDMAHIWRIAEALEYGMVGVNVGIISNETAPFGGVKQSGIGREGSKYGIDEYLEMKYVCMAGI